jgi:hypothetical protein
MQIESGFSRCPSGNRVVTPALTAAQILPFLPIVAVSMDND